MIEEDRLDMVPQKLARGLSPARVQRVPRRLTDGTTRVHFYHRATRAKLPSLDDPNFKQAYEAAEGEFAEAQRKEREGASEHLSRPVPAPDGRTGSANNAEEPSFGDGEQVCYYTPEEVVRRWRGRIDIETLANWRSKRQGPPSHRFGRAILYRADLLAQWEAKHMISCDQLSVTRSEDDAA